MVLTIIALVIYFLLGKHNADFKKENLVTGLTYKKNQIMKFQNVKTSKVFFDFGNFSTPNESKTFKEYFDYVIGVLSEDKIVEDEIEKEVYSGFIFLENYLIDNETEKMLLQNSSILEDAEIGKNLLFMRNLQEKKYFNFSLKEIKPFCCIDNGTLPMMKFDFYRNGNITKIYKPKNLTKLFYDSMTEFLEKVIPKIAEENFDNKYNNISEAKEKEYEKIKNNTLKEDESEDEFDNEYEEENYESKEKESDFEEEENERIRNRRLNKYNKKIKIIKLRNLDKNDSDGINILDNSTDDTEINEILNQEFNTESDFSLNMYNNEVSEGETNKTNLNYYSHSMVRNDYVELKGSQQNVSINSCIDEDEKALKEVHYSHQGRLVNDTNFQEELENERQKSCSDENLLDCNDLAGDTDENIVNTQIKSLDYEVIEDILSTGNYIDIKKKVIGKMIEIFEKFESTSIEIVENYERVNSSGRLLRELTDYILANKFEYSDVEIQIGKGEKNRRLDEYSSYYGMKNMEYSKNIFSLNLLGIEMKLKVVNTMYIKEGKSVVEIILQFAFVKISIKIKTVKTNMHLAIRNYNEMGYTQLYLINESNNKLAERNDKFTNIILNLEKEFNNLITNKYDFGNIFKESFTEMLEEIRNFTSEIFGELIEKIRNGYNNYTEVLNDVIEEKHEVFNEIRIITKNEYIDFIEKMLLSVEEFNNKTYIFLLEVEEEVSKIENFQIDLLYDLKDIIYESKKIFKDFNKNLFNAIEKGIKTFRLDFKDFVHEFMGNLLYLVEFLSINLNKNEILKNGIEEETREEVTTKLKNMRNIINVIMNNLLDKIENDYNEEMNETNLNSIKVNSTKKLNQYLEDLEENSERIIENIKNKIAFMNLYELYQDNIDEIEETTTGIKGVFYNDLYIDVIEKLKNLQPEYLNPNSHLVEKKEKLFEIVNSINKNINNEVNDINQYISSYTKDFKIRRQYIIYYNLYKFRSNFLDSSMESLRKNFENLIKDTVLISIQEKMTQNYNLGIQWLDEVAKNLIPLHKRDECLQKEFWEKDGEFIKVFQSFLPISYSEETIKIYKKYFENIRITILSTIRSKIKKLNYYYFKIPIYEDNFNFVYQINNELEYLISNLENYYSEEYFDMKLAIYIYEFTSDTLTPINDNLYKIYEDLKEICKKNTDCTRDRTWGDYCWNDNRVITNWHYKSVPHTDNYKKLDTSFKEIYNYINDKATKIIDEFTNRISLYLDNYIKEVQTLFDNLYHYSEKKLTSNENIKDLVTQYKEILNDMNEIVDNEMEVEGENVEYFMQNIYQRTIDVEPSFFENYYLKNFTSYLEYPDEVLFKVSNLEKELKSSSEIVKLQINYMISKKIWRIKEESHYFILQTHDFFCKLIKLKLKDKLIFDYYKDYRMKRDLNAIMNKYIYTNKNKKEYLNDNIYDNKIINIISDYKGIISKIENRINEDWILENCTDNISNTDNTIKNTDNTDLIDSDSSNLARTVCYEYKNKSSLNYSEYNFNVVKIRTGIYYIKYLYEILESLFEQFNIDTLMDVNLIKNKDEIINNKNIINLYEKSTEKIIEYNKEAENLLKECWDSYELDLNESTISELDYTENINKFGNILKFKEKNFVLEVNNHINKSLSELFKQYDEYNKELEEQINIANKYEKYNFNLTEFKKVTNEHFTNIKQKLKDIIIDIKNIPNDYLFNNLLKTRLETLNYEKANYFRNIVEDLNKKYKIQPFNLTYDLGQITEKKIIKDFDNLIFKYIYDYIQLYELNKNNYMNSILAIIEKKKDEIMTKFDVIVNNFYNKLIENSTKYIKNDYLIKYENNYTLCHKYIVYQNRLEMCLSLKNNKFNITKDDLEKLNITDSKIIEIIDNIDEKDYFNFLENSKDIKNETLQNLTELDKLLNKLCEETYHNKMEFKNESQFLLDCENNNYYENYLNLTYFDTFDEEIKNNMSEISIKCNKIIDSFYIGTNFIENYLIKSGYINLKIIKTF